MKLAFIALASLLGFAQEWTPFNDPENRRQPERVAAFDVLHYRIAVRLDDRVPPPLVEGKVEIDLAVTTPTSTIDLDADEMSIAEVTAGGPALQFNHQGRRLAIDLGRKASAGEKIKLAITYTAKPTSGLFFITPEPDRPKRPWQVWTQGETEYNHHWFPCYDNPNDRATWEVLATVREKYRTISNGVMAGKPEIKGGWRTEHWKLDIPHVVYLVSLAAGEFDVVTEPSGKTALGYVVPKGWHTEEEIKHTFKGTPGMMKFFENRTGVPYPHAKYDQVVVEDFTWGGMENVTATTLHPGTVVKKRSWDDRDSDGLIAHELAHQWFGDLVTCRTWSHAWLNEGFATYMEALWRESAFGRDDMVADLEDGAGWYFSECKDEYTRPTVCDVYTDPDDHFDSHIYPKGAWILHMLHTQLGDELWWKGVKHYLEKHRATVVTTDDFRAAMEEATGKDLKRFFTQWVMSAGHPELKVTSQWDAASGTLAMNIEQVQVPRPLIWKDFKTEVPIFDISFDIEIETKDGRKSERVEMKGKSHSVHFKLGSEPDIIDIDRDNAILKTLEFERRPDQLIEQLKKDDQPWHRRWAASKLAGAHGGVEALKAALQNDSSKFVRIAAAKALGATGTPEARAALLEKLPADARVRKSVIDALASHAKDAGDELEKFFLGDASPACRAAAAEALGKRAKSAAAFNDLSKVKDDEVVMPGVLSGMLGSDDPRLIKTCLEATGPAVHPLIRAKAAECLAKGLGKTPDDAGKKRLVQLFDDSNYRIRRAAIKGALDAKDKSLASALEQRMAREPEKRLQKDIREIIRKLRAEK